MKDGASKSFVQAYNAQAAVDAEAQVIVAADATPEANDKRQLVPLLTQVTGNGGAAPAVASADSGYCSEAALTDPARAHRPARRPGPPAAWGAAGQDRAAPAPDGTALTAMRAKLQTSAGQAVYALRNR